MKYKKSIFVTIVSFLLVVGLVSAATVTIDELREMLSGDTFGSVTVGNEYNSTTLVPTSAVGDVITNYQAVLGSVIMYGGAGGGLTIYNATTTNKDLRTGQTATTSLEKVAAFQASQAAGTYTFDVTGAVGLIYEFAGAVATSTITYR